MKFTLNNDHQNNRYMNILLSGILIFTLFFLVSNVIVKKEFYGETPSEVVITIFGNEDVFIEPIPFSTLLEGVHADIFFTMMSLLTLGVIYGRVGRKKFLKILLINIMLLSSLISLIAPIFAYFFSTIWVSIWFWTFVIWHLSAIFVSLISLWRIRFS